MKTSFWQRWRPWGRTIQRPTPQRGPRLRLEQLEDRTLLSGTPQLLADINPGTASSLVSPPMAVIGSTTYFSANDGTHGFELWKTDGTTAGTSMVADINPGSGNSYPCDLTNVNGTLFFQAREGTHGAELWKSDGTAAGTVLVADINPGSNGSYPVELTNVNGTLFFQASGSLWKSDGTTSGTVQVSNAAGWPNNLTNVNGELYFAANDASGETDLWKSDGTAAGTVRLTSNVGVGNIVNVNGTLYFWGEDANGIELWKSDGTTAGTVRLTGSEDPSDFTNVNGTLYFTASGGIRDGSQLWKSNGTAAGTVEVAGFYNDVGNLTNFNGELYFAANDGTHGAELWKSDGTTAGTTMVKDINPGTTTTWYYTGSYGTYTKNVTRQGSYPTNLTNVNGTLYFSANDGTHGEELWQSDGTTSGTTLVQDIHPGSSVYSYSFGSFYGYETRSATLPNNSNPTSLTNFNGTLLFAANDGTHGNEPWILAPAATSAASLAVTGFPATITAGTAGSFTVTAENADGSTDTSYTGTIHFTSSDGQAVLPANYTFTAADAGVHTFSATLKTAGTQSITVTDPNVGTTGSETGISVNSAAASKLIVSGFPSTTTAGVAHNFTITLEDAYGNIATGYTGTVHFTSSDPKAKLPANYTFTATNKGVHTFSATLKTAGTQSLTATDSTTASLTGTEGNITVHPAAAHKFLLSAPTSVSAGAPFSLTVTVEDAYGNVVVGYRGTIHFSSSDSTATLPANYTFTAGDAGVHTFTGLVLYTKGQQKISVTSTQNSALTGSDSISVG